MRSTTIIIITLSILLVGSVSSLVINTDIDKFNPDNKKYIIPEWVKHNADWWSKGYISDADFTYSMEYLINQGIINVKDCDGRCLDENYE